MAVTAGDLVGAWCLESWSIVSTDGTPPEFPLGTNAVGRILYTPDGHVSATLSRADRGGTAPVSVADKVAAFDSSFAYAGRFRVADGAAYHSIEIATNPALVGLTSTRHIRLEGDRLTLSGPDFSGGGERTQRIVWRRARAAA